MFKRLKILLNSLQATTSKQNIRHQQSVCCLEKEEEKRYKLAN